MPMLHIYVNGTAGSFNHKGNKFASCLVSFNGSSVLIDAGEGTQFALYKGKCTIKTIDYIFISHMHADHMLGLTGVLLAISNSGRTAPVNLILPSHSAVKTASIFLFPFVHSLNFSIKYRVADAQKQFENKKAGYKLSFLPLQHNLPCYGIRIDTNRTPKFDKQKAIERGVPQRLWATLIKDTSSKIDGFCHEDVVDATVTANMSNLSFAYIADTGPAAINDISVFLKGATVAFCECSYYKISTDKERAHLCVEDIKNIDYSGTLYLTHFDSNLTFFPPKCVEELRARNIHFAREDQNIKLTYPKE